MPIFWQRWKYETYFGGEHTYHTALDTPENAVRTALDRRHGRDNWRSDTLRKGGKVKDHNAYPRL